MAKKASAAADEAVIVSNFDCCAIPSQDKPRALTPEDQKRVDELFAVPKQRIQRQFQGIMSMDWHNQSLYGAEHDPDNYRGWSSM